MNYPVIIVDYDPRWPSLFQEEKQRILALVGSPILAIEHIGSTAIPGLGAKPTIDIMIGFARLSEAEAAIKPLERLGYEYLPEFEDKLPERRFLRKARRNIPTHHLHMVELTSGFWEEHIAFRDFLRAHPEEAQQYLQLKKDLATRFGSDRRRYTESKTAFVMSIVERAYASKALDLK